MFYRLYNCKTLDKMELSQNVTVPLEYSKTINFEWGKVANDIVRHTAIIVSFDAQPRVVIHFRAASHDDLTKLGNFLKGAVQLVDGSTDAIKTEIAADVFDYDEDYKVMGRLLEFSTESERNKKRAKDLIRKILKINMGTYNVKTNNCRHFVMKAFREVLEKEPESQEEDKAKFLKEIESVLEVDWGLAALVKKVATLIISPPQKK